MSKANILLATTAITLLNGCAETYPENITSEIVTSGTNLQGTDIPRQSAINLIIEQEFRDSSIISRRVAAGLGVGIARFCSKTDPNIYIDEATVNLNDPEYIRGIKISETALSPGSMYLACKNAKSQISS
jgi:hypothetical protein